MKTCEYCGELYEPNPITAKRQRFCQDSCSRAWWAENRKKASKRYNHTCSNCGEQFETLRTDSLCCSKECTHEWIGKQVHEQALINKQCLVCETVFEGNQSGSDYCSEECKQKAYTKTCIQCGQEFLAEQINTGLCSDACRKAQDRQRKHIHKRAINRHQGRTEYPTCEYCGEQFEYEVYNRVPRYCSRRCSRLAWKEEHPNKVRVMRTKQRHVRRARKYGNGRADNIDPLVVFNRDGWRCGICGKKVSERLKHPHPMSVSLDHIVPLAKGGKHIWSNVQCAHLRCNSLKQDAPGGQLRLGITHEVDNGG